MPKNPLTQTRLSALRYELETKHNVRIRLSYDLADAVLLRNFMKKYITVGSQAAHNTLPQDNPETTDRNEHDDALNAIQTFYEKVFPSGNFPQIQAGYVDTIENKVKEIIAFQRYTDVEMDDINREIKQIQSLEQSDNS